MDVKDYVSGRLHIIRYAADMPTAIADFRESSRPGTASNMAVVGSDGTTPLNEAELGLAERVGAHRDNKGRLHVPAEHVPVLTSEVTSILGRLKSPPSLSALGRSDPALR